MSGYEKLLHAVINSAVDDKDVEFLKSQVFDEYCYYLGIEDDEAVESLREKLLERIEG